MEAHDSENDSDSDGLKALSTEELIRKLQEASREEHPNKQTLREYIDGKIEEGSIRDDGGDDPPNDQGKRIDWLPDQPRDGR